MVDASGRGRDGVVNPPGSMRVVAGRKGDALHLEGAGRIDVAEAPDPANRPLTFGAWCRPLSTHGVVLAHGGESHGYALYLVDGFPHCALRVRGQLHVVRGADRVAPGEWTHLAGVFGSDAEIGIWVNGIRVAGAPANPIAALPAEGLTIGDDPGSPVAVYPAGQSTAWHGDLEDLRIYWGELDGDALKTWAGMRP